MEGRDYLDALFHEMVEKFAHLAVREYGIVLGDSVKDRIHQELRFNVVTR